MGSMMDDEYTRKFLDFLRYMTYLKDKKAKIQRFISGLPIEFKDWIEFDEPWSLEEATRELKHYYEKLNCTCDSKHDWK